MNADIFNEMRDFFVTLALAFRIHKGKEKKMLKTLHTIRKRLIYADVIVICDQFIQNLDRIEFLLNATTENYFGLQFLKIKRFGHGH